MTVSARGWHRLYDTCGAVPVDGAVTGFTANADRVIRVDRDRLEHDPRFQRPGMEEITSRLRQSMDRQEADEWFMDDVHRYAEIARAFGDEGEIRLGGQAGIAATHLASRITRRVAYYTPGAPAACRQAMDRSGARPLLPHPSGPPLTPSCHLVFEYPATGGGRANRFITSPRERWTAPLLPPEAHDDLDGVLSGYTRAFLSGYQYLEDADAARTAARELSLLGEHIRTHVECVALEGRDIRRSFVEQILPAVHSAGANEMELRVLLEGAGEQTRAQEIADGPAGLLEGALALHRRIGGRLHVHTHGYYLAVLDRGITDPARSRDALLYAAREAVLRAGGGRPGELSAAGRRAVELVEETADRVAAAGVCMRDGRWVIAVPTLLAEPAVHTVGLGDVLSSTAFVCDPMV
ncbi:MAG: ADP-dependent glucokinase/phosphofructokinase [Methanomicrobiales archaeon]